MKSDPCIKFFSEEIPKGLIARIGLPAYGVLSVIAAAESSVGRPVRMSLEKIAELMGKSVEKIAELMGKSVETTRTALDLLKQHDLVTIELQGRNNVYSVKPLSGKSKACFRGSLCSVELPGNTCNAGCSSRISIAVWSVRCWLSSCTPNS